MNFEKPLKSTFFAALFGVNVSEAFTILREEITNSRETNTINKSKFWSTTQVKEGAWINPRIWLRPCSDLWIDSDHSNDSNIRYLTSSSCSFPHPTKRIFIMACLNITYMELCLWFEIETSFVVPNDDKSYIKLKIIWLYELNLYLQQGM